jgi:hypothetical protein
MENVSKIVNVNHNYWFIFIICVDFKICENFERFV